MKIDPNTERQDQPTVYLAHIPVERDGDISLIELFYAFWKYRWIMLVFVLVITGASVVIALLIKPSYQATVLLSPNFDDSTNSQLAALTGSLGGLANLGFGKFSPNNRKEDEAIAMLRSRAFTSGFLEKHDILPYLFPDSWDPKEKAWKTDDGLPPDIRDAVQVFSESIRTVMVDESTGLVTLGMTWNDPVLAARWANWFVTDLNEHIRQRDIAEAERSLDFLNEQLDKASTLELRQGIFRLIEHQVESVMLANVRKEYAFKILDPAVTPNIDDPVSPNRRLIVISAFLISVVLALVLASIWSAVQDSLGSDK